MIPKVRIGLALGSGAARGWAHIGAIRALTELGISPDVICGTSIGSLVGGFHLAGHLQALEDWARSLTKFRMFRYMDIRLTGNGMISGNKLFAEMERRLTDTRFEDLPIPFATVATDLYSGHEIWLSEGSLAPAIRASFSLPGLFEPVHVNGRWVIDGALVNPVPVSVCHALGAQVIIAINLNVPQVRNEKTAESLDRGLVNMLPGFPAALRRNAKPGAHRNRKDDGDPDTPSLIGVLASTMNLIQDRVTRGRLAADPPDVNIVPKLGNIGLLDFHGAAECIDAGANAVHLAAEDIRDALSLFAEAVP